MSASSVNVGGPRRVAGAGLDPPALESRGWELWQVRLHQNKTRWHMSKVLCAAKQQTASGDEQGTPFNTRLLL